MVGHTIAKTVLDRILGRERGLLDEECCLGSWYMGCMDDGRAPKGDGNFLRRRTRVSDVLARQLIDLGLLLAEERLELVCARGGQLATS